MIKTINMAKDKIEKKEEEKPKRFVASEVLPEGEIVEMVYREQNRETLLAMFDGKSVSYHKKIERPSETILPYPIKNHLISKKVVLFPSDATEYGSEVELLHRINGFINRYLDIESLFAEIAAYYVMFSWVYEKFSELAYLRVIGDYGSGKSRFLKTIGSLCYKPMFTGGSTTVSPIFRIIDSFNGTLILDEADYRFSDTTSEMIKILNSGFQRGIPVLRSEGSGKYTVKSYDVFCPKLIATRRRFADIALESRCLTSEFDNKQLRADIPVNLPPQFDSEATEIRNMLLMWRFRNCNSVGLKSDVYDKSVEPRLNQIVTPLLSIISDSNVKANIKQLIQQYNRDLIDERYSSVEAEVFDSLLACHKLNVFDPTIGQICNDFNLRKTTAKEQLTSKRLGYIVRHQLKLRTTRTREGYAVMFSENSRRIAELKNRYGVVDDVPLVEADVNNVHIVNVEAKATDEIELGS
jgi:hypothetical protein